MPTFYLKCNGADYTNIFLLFFRQGLSLNNMESRFDKINQGLLGKVWEYKTPTKKECSGKSALLQRPSKADLELTKIH